MQRPEKKRLRVVLFITLSLVLILGGAAWAIRRSGVSAADLKALMELPAGTLLAVAALCAAIYGTDVYRYQALGRALGVTVGARAALEASIANFFFAWTTPGAALGAPAAIVMLKRRGVAWESATLISLGKSFLSTAIVLALAFIALAAGIGPALGPEIHAVLVAGTGAVTLVLGLGLADVFFPGRFLGFVDRAEVWARRRGLVTGGPASRLKGRILTGLARGLRDLISRLAYLRRAGLAAVLKIAASQLAFFAVYVAVAVVLAAALEADSLVRAAGASTVYVAFSYVAPTPGGAGLSEAAATLFYGSILPPARAVILALLFRALTFYLQIAVGILYLPFAGGWKEILESSAKREHPG